MSDPILSRHSHVMPFGTHIETDGQVTFSLWAPHAERVDLRLFESADAVDLLMSAEGDWHTLTTPLARVGSRYSFVIDGALAVPDPASRFQPDDVHDPSQVIDPHDWQWCDHDWRGRPWHDTVIYELHVGTFSPSGDFDGVREKLDYLAELGVTALELMPLADFPGRWNWGYDGALLFAPDSRYGTPAQLKQLIQEAHQKGLMVFLDVVYNHFGPEGNYLHVYNQCFFAGDKHTPWGAGVNFDGDNSETVRQFFIHNALYWLEEYRFDGLRFDAVDRIYDDSGTHILDELAQVVRRYFEQRHIHLMLENDDNTARLLGRDAGQAPELFDAQWNDDFHHALHVLLGGEQSGYYRDYVDDPHRHFTRCLTEGFAYQGTHSPYRGALRGEPSAHLPPSAFVTFLQNHDQVGNRPLGERITDSVRDHRRIRAAITILLLAPAPPLLFMGEEWGATTPFPFFCDLSDEFAAQVESGRLRGFDHFPEFNDQRLLQQMPGPLEERTFLSAVLNWPEHSQDKHLSWLKIYRELLRLRHAHIVPLVRQASAISSRHRQSTERVLSIEWKFEPVGMLNLFANLGDDETFIEEFAGLPLIYASEPDAEIAWAEQGRLPPWSVVWVLQSCGRN